MKLLSYTGNKTCHSFELVSFVCFRSNNYFRRKHVLKSKLYYCKMTQKNNKIQRCKQTTNKHTNIHKANNVITTRKDFLKLYDLIENYIFNSLLIISAPNRSLFLLRLAIAINRITMRVIIQLTSYCFSFSSRLSRHIHMHKPIDRRSVQ